MVNVVKYKTGDIMKKLILLISCILFAAASGSLLAQEDCPDSNIIKKQAIVNADPNPLFGANHWDATTGVFTVIPGGSLWNVAVQNFEAITTDQNVAMAEATKILSESTLVQKPIPVPRPDDPSQFMCIYLQKGELGKDLLIAAYQYKRS